MFTVNDHHYNAQDFDKYYQDFANTYANSQKAFGEKNTVVAICLKDNALWLALCLYLRSQRISVMPIHPATPLQTAQGLAQKAGCHLLYYHQLDEPIGLSTQLAQQSSTATAGLIQMSSGTTGSPKCIYRSWDEIDIEIDSYIQSFQKARTMTPVVACPVTHSYGLICGVLVALARGKHPIIVDNINPKYLLKILLSCEQPLLYTSPTLLQGLMLIWPQHPPLHAAITSGNIMSSNAFKQISPQVTHLFQQYGCSESGCISINQQVTSTHDMGTPLSHLSVNSGESANSPQEIVVTLQQKEEAQPAPAEKKIIHTQDLGYLHKQPGADPSLYFVSRLDDTIIVAGLNVYPQDIEDAVLNYDGIADVVAFKIDDRYAGQRVCLYYVSDTVISAQEIRRWCQIHLAPQQMPQVLLQVKSIERMANGKINRKQLAENFHQIQQTTAKEM